MKKSMWIAVVAVIACGGRAPVESQRPAEELTSSMAFEGAVRAQGAEEARAAVRQAVLDGYARSVRPVFPPRRAFTCSIRLVENLARYNCDDGESARNPDLTVEVGSELE